MNSTFNNRKFKGGAYTTAISLLVIVLILIVNLIVSGAFRSKDLTATGFYSLNADTVDYLKKYDTPIDLYYVCEVGQEMKMLTSVAENFAAEAKDISLKYIDPEQYPQFVMQYSGVGETVNSNSIILINRNDDSLYAYVDRDDMVTYEISMEDYKTKLISGYCAEAALIRALSKVSDTKETVVYVATGHGEQLISEAGEVNESITALLSLNSYSVKTVNLKTSPVPEDCEALLLLGMINDLTKEESDKIKDYFAGGGKVVWFLTYTGVERPVQKALLNYYGLYSPELLLCEGDKSRSAEDKPQYILATNGKNITGWVNGVGISLLGGARDSIEREAKYLTSKQSYLTDDLSNPVYKEGDETGPFALLIKVSETFRGNTGMMYVFNTQYFLAPEFIQQNSAYSNGEAFVEALSDLCNKEGVISIPDKAAMEEALVMTTQQRRVLMTVLIGVIPGIVLLLGIFVFIMRRK